MTPNEKLLREALNQFIHSQYPVSEIIDARGHAWSETWLDEALITAIGALAAVEQPARQDAAYAELRAACENVLSDQCAIHRANFDMLANPAAVLALLADNDRLTERLAHHDEAANKCIDTAIKQGLAERDALAERVAVLEAALMDCARHPRKKQRGHIVSRAMAKKHHPHPHADEAAKAGSVAPVAVAIVSGSQVQWLDGAAKVPARSTLFWFPPSPAEGKSR